MNRNKHWTWNKNAKRVSGHKKNSITKPQSDWKSSKCKTEKEEKFGNVAERRRQEELWLLAFDREGSMESNAFEYPRRRVQTTSGAEIFSPRFLRKHLKTFAAALNSWTAFRFNLPVASQRIPIKMIQQKAFSWITRRMSLEMAQAGWGRCPVMWKQPASIVNTRGFAHFHSEPLEVSN